MSLLSAIAKSANNFDSFILYVIVTHTHANIHIDNHNLHVQSIWITKGSKGNDTIDVNNYFIRLMVRIQRTNNLTVTYPLTDDVLVFHK